MPLDFFISHSHEDRKIASELVNFFTEGVGVEKKDIRCTSITSTGLSVGSNIQDELRKDLKKCRYFVPLITPQSIARQFVLFEIGAAWVLGKDVIPLYVGEFSDIKVPSILSNFLHLNINDIEGLIKLAEELSEIIFYKSSRPSASQMASAAARLASS